MKYLIPILLLFTAIRAQAQYPAGVDSTSFNGRPAIVKIPAGTGKFGLMIEWGPSAETADNSSCGMCTLFNTGIFKLIKAGANPYFLRGDMDSAKWIIVKIQGATYHDGSFSNDMAAYLPAIMAYVGTKVDSSKYLDGTYKYIGMVGEEMGADAIFNSVTQNNSAGNCFYHADPGWVFHHIKKLYVARVNDVCNIGSVATTAYMNSTTEKVWYYRVNGAGTIEPSLYSNLNTWSPGVVQTLTNFSLSTSQLSDTLYSIKGLYHPVNIFRDLLNDTTNHPPPNYQAKVYAIFPLSTYAQHDPNPPKNFFDGYGVTDPKNGVTTDTTSIGNPQHGYLANGGSPLKPQGEYFLSGNIYGALWPGQRDARLVIDLGGTSDLSDTARRFSITDIYGYSDEEVGHKIYFYNGNALFRSSNMLVRAQMLARLDSLMVPFDSLTTTGYGAGWINVPAHDSMRYVIIRITTSGSHTAQFAELSFYGHYVTADTAGRTAALMPPTYTGPLPDHRDTMHTYGKTNGDNVFLGLGPNSTAYSGDIRVYTSKWYMDTSNLKIDTPRLKFWISPDVNPAWLAALRARGQWGHYTNQTSNQHTAAQGTQTDVDDNGMDPELPTSYMRAGWFAYNYAAKYGSVAVPSSMTAWVGDAGYPNGLGLQRVAEFGNEVEGHGGSYVAMFFKLSMEYDGHCGMFGPVGRMGIKNADPSMLLSVPGMIDPDTGFVATSAFMAALTRPDKQVPWDIFACHKYVTQKDVGYGIYHSLEEQIGIRGESPIWSFGPTVGWLNYWETMGRNFYRWVPLSKQIDLTESGWGNCNDTIKNTTEAASIYDIYPCLAFGGHNVHQSKAIWQAQLGILNLFTPITSFNNYASSNQFGDIDNSNRFLFYAYGQAGAIDGSFEFTVFFDSWYVKGGLYNQLKNYRRDAIVYTGGRTGAWWLRLRHAWKADSVVYVSLLGSYTGATLGSQSLPFSNLNSQSIRRWVPSYSDVLGTNTTLTAVGGVLGSQTIQEMVTLYFAQETPVRYWRARKYTRVKQI